jgi:hypothetical protein
LSAASIAAAAFVSAFLVRLQQHCWIMAAVRGDDMHRHASIEQGGFVASPQIVKAQFLEATAASTTPYNPQAGCTPVR